MDFRQMFVKSGSQLVHLISNSTVDEIDSQLRQMASDGSTRTYEALKRRPSKGATKKRKPILVLLWLSWLLPSSGSVSFH